MHLRALLLSGLLLVVGGGTARGTMLILDKFYFRTGSAELVDVTKRMLDDYGKAITQRPELGVIEVQGFTDDVERKTTADAQTLSTARAEAIVKYLVDHGVDASRLVARGYGRTVPLCRARTETCRAKNRRVELLPLDPAKR